MNKTMLAALLCVLVNSGCTSWFDTRSVTAPVHPSASQALPKGPITADLVETGNAHRVADAVWDEMARDEHLPGAEDEAAFAFVTYSRH